MRFKLIGAAKVKSVQAFFRIFRQQCALKPFWTGLSASDRRIKQIQFHLQTSQYIQMIVKDLLPFSETLHTADKWLIHA